MLPMHMCFCAKKSTQLDGDDTAVRLNADWLQNGLEQEKERQQSPPHKEKCEKTVAISFF